MTHPDVTTYAQFFPLSAKEIAVIEEHLQQCGECRDLVLFVRKTNATLRQEGRIDRVAKALRMSIDDIKREMRLGTSMAALINRPPDMPVRPATHPVQPIAPMKK
jgi:urease accessory protein UreF